MRPPLHLVSLSLYLSFFFFLNKAIPTVKTTIVHLVESFLFFSSPTEVRSMILKVCVVPPSGGARPSGNHISGAGQAGTVVYLRAPSTRHSWEEAEGGGLAPQIRRTNVTKEKSGTLGVCPVFPPPPPTAPPGVCSG